MAKEMDFLDEILAELGPEQKQELLASAVASLSPINEATAPGAVLTTGGRVPAFEAGGAATPTLGYIASPGISDGGEAPLFTVGSLATGQVPQVEFDPQNLMQTMNLSQVDRARIQPDLTPVTVGAPVDELPVMFTPDVQAAELLAKAPRQKPIAGEKEFDAFLAEQEAEAGQAVVEQATAPASTDTTEPLAEQVALSGVMQPTGLSSMEQVRMRTRGVDRTNEQYQRRLQLSRLLELQALRQLQKAEQVKAQPRSLMDLYRGGYERRAAQEAQRRINMARQYFNRSGAIQRELVREKDIERKAAAAEQRAAGLDAALQEKIAKRKAQEEFKDRELDIKSQRVAASLARLNTLTPYQKGVLANMSRRASAAQKRALKAMSSEMKGTWQKLLAESNKELRDLRRQESGILRQLSQGFVRRSVRDNLNKQLDEIAATKDAIQDKASVYEQALTQETEQATGIEADGFDYGSLLRDEEQ